MASSNLLIEASIIGIPVKFLRQQQVFWFFSFCSDTSQFRLICEVITSASNEVKAEVDLLLPVGLAKRAQIETTLLDV